MTAQLIFSVLLFSVFAYAWTEHRRTPLVAALSALVATAGFYFVWFPAASTHLAEIVGIGRGVDLILYTWGCISLLVILNLHLKLRTQLELITVLARTIAIANAQALSPDNPARSDPTPSSVHRRDMAALSLSENSNLRLSLRRPPPAA